MDSLQIKEVHLSHRLFILIEEKFRVHSQLSLLSINFDI
ncbi:hypothetical protein Amico_0484 [Aminobacterium colombiense DSM 12261]|uniref:Uncharacterized protein n=1 Tax=Aminobacterium colombiense (strain DSM 12261 / ALA-1) TaxID=572547 RepID=D5EDJ1_AMICL|nr:hypothetical protein Amico_0484 [Aminobacterium colombiense DSM 12261]